MRKIKLTRGLFAKIDDCDFQKVNRYIWFAVINKNKKGIVNHIAAATKSDGHWRAQPYYCGKRVSVS